MLGVDRNYVLVRSQRLSESFWSSWDHQYQKSILGSPKENLWNDRVQILAKVNLLERPPMITEVPIGSGHGHYGGKHKTEENPFEGSLGPVARIGPALFAEDPLTHIRS